MPLTAQLKTRWLCLTWILLAIFLHGCDDGASGPPSQDLITAEVRAAIAAGDLAALSAANLPELLGIDQFIVDEGMAVVLGKAFFWEMYTGNNGQACASCHFHAGTDRRIQNTLHPGGKDEAIVQGDAAGMENSLFRFDPTRSGFPGGPNYILGEHDFPFHEKADPANRDSSILFDTDDVVGSQGVLNAEFHSLDLDGRTRVGKDPEDNVDCEPVGDALFNIGGPLHPHTRVRSVTPRNTPTMINAALNHRSFWDGRGNHIFNGVNTFGRRDGHAKVWKVTAPDGVPTPVAVRLENASLASQAVAPPLSTSDCDPRLRISAYTRTTASWACSARRTAWA